MREPEGSDDRLGETLTDPGASARDLRRVFAVLAIAGPAAQEAALRFLRLRKGRFVASLDQVDAELRALEAQHPPGIGDE